jgi:hypothetical protein
VVFGVRAGGLRIVSLAEFSPTILEYQNQRALNTAITRATARA